MFTGSGSQPIAASGIDQEKCTRLGKECDYTSPADEGPRATKTLLTRLQDLEDRLEQASAAPSNTAQAWSVNPHVEYGTQRFFASPFVYVCSDSTIINRRSPLTLYFLDSESSEKQPASVLDPGMQVPEEVLHVLGSIGEFSTDLGVGQLFGYLGTTES